MTRTPGLPRKAASGEGRACPSLARVLNSVLRFDKPEILDLGPLCGPTAVFLADRGARVSVEDFRPPPPTPKPAKGQSVEDVEKQPVTIDQPNGKFHLVLAWEALDFTPPDRLADLAAEIRRVLAEGGWLLLFSLNDKSPSDSYLRPGRYLALDDSTLLRQGAGGASDRRWAHPTRDLERALAPLKVQGIHLQRDQMREILALKPKPKPRPPEKEPVE